MIFELAVLFAFGAMLSWAFGDLLIQHATRKVGNVQTLAVIGIVGSIGLVPFILRDWWRLASLENIVFLVALGIITFITAILDFEALKEGKLSVIDVIFEIELPVTIALSMIFFKESLSVIQYVIIALMLCGMVLVATKSFSHWKNRLERGAWLALAAAIMMGVVNFMTASSSRNISPMMAVWFPWVVYTIICLAVIWQREGIKDFGKNIVKFRWILLASGIVDTLAWIFYAFATRDGEIAIMTAITECFPAVAIFLGIWINREKSNWHQYVGAILALGGAITLALTVK
jgi:transporter family protein